MQYLLSVFTQVTGNNFQLTFKLPSLTVTLIIPPPFRETIHGNRQTLPKPTAKPRRDKTDSTSFAQKPRGGSF